MITYKKVGVDIEAGAQTVQLLKEKLAGTYGLEVLKGIGGFGGLFDISVIKAMQSPILVASTDGVGTKSEVAVKMGRFDTIGYDIVNHCINDILVQGATPLFFLDYIATAKLDPAIVMEILTGIINACKVSNCALLGGETAEMPDVYAPNSFDLVGTVVGVVERSAIIDGRTIAAGNTIIGLRSSGLHTNGYSLARQVLSAQDWHDVEAELGQSLGETLLTPHRSYLAEIQELQANNLNIKGMAHITGGGLIDNLPRILPNGVAAHIQRESWSVPPIFGLIQRIGGVDEAEMMHVFNMGLGLLLVVSAGQVDLILSLLEDHAWVVGKIVSSGDEPHVRIA